ncbi:uncharacterized protein LOC111062519 [Nilaparvata lugens]|uniref:uncharacterized protein LOC111062519 n=1 Tax=Nilaparvata lugens TaxID=108931 RepID=UPI00193D40B4|nr:uncharacterized protein LOC111062519 [Nilaparvata lugens]
MGFLTWSVPVMALILLSTTLRSTEAVDQPAGLLTGLRVIYNSYRHCEDQDDTMLCLKWKALKLVDRALHSEDIPLIEGVSLVKRSGEERSLSDNTVESEPLPVEAQAREKRIDSLLWEKAAAFIQTHSLQLHVPRLIATSRQMLEDTFDDSTDQEGRGKKKKYMGPLLLGLMMKGGLLAMGIKGLALLAGKALIVSKLALVLAGIVALKKLFSGGGGGGEKTTYEIVKQPIVSHAHQYSTSHEFSGGHNDWAGGHSGVGSGGYARSLQLPAGVPYPQLLAYRGQLPVASSEEDSPQEAPNAS